LTELALGELATANDAHLVGYPSTQRTSFSQPARIACFTPPPVRESSVMRWRVLGVVTALASAGSLAYASSGAAIPSQPLTGRVPGHVSPGPPHGQFSAAGHRYQIVIEPELQVGGSGWETFLTYSHGGGEGGGGGYPTASWPFAGGSGFVFYGGDSRLRGDVVDYVITGPDVAAVRVGKETISTFSDPRLPAGDRAAVFFRPAALPSVILAAAPIIVPGMGRVHTIRLFPLDSSGHVIPTHLPREAPFQRVRFWQAPSAITPNIHERPYQGPKHPLPGACELGQHGLRALKPEWGHVIARVHPVTDGQGEVFLPCVDTEYYLHGWPLEVSILVDAAQPGKTLGAIPGTTPVAGHPGTVNLAVGQFPGGLTAEQIGQAWLVVQGGASLAQRLRVLEALRIAKLQVGAG
jgi:hypothetical protein